MEDQCFRTYSGFTFVKIFLMQKIYLLALAFVIGMNAHAQQTVERNGIGVHFSGIDYFGPQGGTYFLDVPNSTTTKKQLFWDPSVRVSLWHAFSQHFDGSLALYVSTLQHPTSDKDSAFIKSKTISSSFKNASPMVAGDLKINYNILPKQKFILTPFISAGLSMLSQETMIVLDAPVGLGVNVKLAKSVYFNLASDYHVALSQKAQNHLIHSAGIVYWFGREKKAKVVPPPPVVIKDTDNDGIADADDKCPTLPGKRDLKGCPDKDNDGIADMDDLCPDVVGSRQFNGCPDKDNDGIPDKQDKCPDVAGISKYGGCPVPDSDQDGFNDEVDKCPTIASSTNGGCPEIKKEVIEKVSKAAKGVNFQSGSATILKKSNVNLDKIVEILKAEPNLQVDIEGHTDNKGKPESNLVLSQKRADACKQYLIDHGIAAGRINSTGFGDSKPIADNATEAGRASNRRTEFILKN